MTGAEGQKLEPRTGIYSPLLQMSEAASTRIRATKTAGISVYVGPLRVTASLGVINLLFGSLRKSVGTMIPDLGWVRPNRWYGRNSE